jgi:uracil-DNA glycosylase
MRVDWDKSWNDLLKPEIRKEYFIDLERAVDLAYQKRHIFPSDINIFKAFKLCPLDKVKVVILGQDPYHQAGQAHGLAFSVPEGEKIPPSLKNIYKELASDTNKKVSGSGSLEHWAKQGVLLLNSTLTVEEGQPGFHQGWGWETFTDQVIKTVSAKKEHVVFLLWGKFAQDKEDLIDNYKHLVLKAPHPSPLSAHRGFFGCQHFSKTNEFLIKHGKEKINW